MKKIVHVVPFVFLLGMAPVVAETTPPSDWHVGGSLVYGSRSLEGSAVNKNAIAGDAFGTLLVTGDSMNVDDSKNVMLALAAQYRQVGMGINYMPTSFKGSGYALAEAGGDNAGLMVRTPLMTDISVDMLLANAYYNFIQTPASVFGIGAGLGQTAIDLSIVPQVGNAMVYEGNQPFGFLNVHMQNQSGKLLYGFSLNGISADFEGAGVNYSDYKVDIGYRLLADKFKLDLVGGYRLVNFAIDLEGVDSTIAADFSLEGPFAGLTLVY